MADQFNVDLHNPKLSYPEMNSNGIESLNNMNEIEGFHTNSRTNMPLFNQGFSDHHQPQLIPMNFNQEFSRTIQPSVDLSVYDPSLLNFFPSEGRLSHGSNGVNLARDSDMLLKYSASVSAPGSVEANKSTKNYANYGGKKRKRMNETESQKPTEVVHVRAKRGQATDSHSLAERLRREKINEKLRSLQDLVPGCYKTMGMAVMLDVIINYVRSLQNQIDFLSMKLTAASLFYDFNSSEAEAIESVQGTTGYEAQGMVLGGERYGAPPQSHSSWPFL